MRRLRVAHPSVGLDETNLASALAGRRPMPATARAAIEAEVGIPAERWDDLRPHERRPPTTTT
ncbi:MAG: hypothetical protein AAGN46_04570 [Acidobacteriota bacterium]